MLTLKDFEMYDFDCYFGAKRFGDGSVPMKGEVAIYFGKAEEHAKVTVIAHKEGVMLYWNDGAMKADLSGMDGWKLLEQLEDRMDLMEFDKVRELFGIDWC